MTELTSPCTGICKRHPTTGWCLGCGRTDDEISEWTAMTDDQHDRIWGEVAERLDKLGTSCCRLPWNAQDIRAFVVQTLAAGQNTWEMGVVGAMAQFPARKGAPVSVSQHGDNIAACSAHASLHMTVNSDIRALQFREPRSEAPSPIILAVLRERGRLPMASVITDLGVDPNTSVSANPCRLFDLGLGRKEARVVLRVGSDALANALQTVVGQRVHEAFDLVMTAQLDKGSTVYVQTMLGRLEIKDPLSAIEGSAEAGVSFQLVMEDLLVGRGLPVGLELPRAYWPGAIIYPAA